MGPLGNGVDYCRGFYQSLRPTQMGLSLNLDMSARAFYRNILVSDFVSEYLGKSVTRSLSDQDRIMVKKSLRNIKVEVANGGFKRTYIVLNITKEPTSQLTNKCRTVRESKGSVVFLTIVSEDGYCCSIGISKTTGKKDNKSTKSYDEATKGNDTASGTDATSILVPIERFLTAYVGTTTTLCTPSKSHAMTGWHGLSRMLLPARYDAKKSPSSKPLT
nr:PAZ domain-containing protein [Tanacetum cinerariifolium]